MQLFWTVVNYLLNYKKMLNMDLNMMFSECLWSLRPLEIPVDFAIDLMNTLKFKEMMNLTVC